MKRKKGFIIIISIAAIIVLTGATLAAFVTSTPVDEVVSTTNLEVGIMKNGQEVAAEGNIQVAKENFMGGQVDETVAAINKGDTPCYIRMTVNRSWMDGSGEKIFEVNGKPLKPEDIEIQTKSSSWQKVEDPEDPEVLYYYYRSVVPEGVQTEQVMDSYTVFLDITQNSNQYVGLIPEISFEVDAIQTTQAVDAMLAEWGVVAELDGETLVKVTEQQ